MQWLIDSVLQVWRDLYPNIEKAENIAPDLDILIRGDGDKWVGTPVQTILNNYPRYFDAGDKNDPDFLTGDFAIDGNWHSLALEGLIPAGTYLVNLAVVCRPTLAGRYLVFSTTSTIGSWNANLTRPPLANMLFSQNVMVQPTGQLRISYQFQGGSFDYCALTVRGWFK